DLTLIGTIEAIGQGEDARLPMLPVDLAAIERRIIERGVKLLIIDPVLGYMADGIDSHKDQSVRRVMHQLALVEQRTAVAILLIRHLSKQPGGPALYRGGGSIAIIAAARSALLLGQDPEDENRRILARNKGNLCACPRSLAYSLKPDGDVAT